MTRWPRLRDTHPGYFKVCVSVAGSHAVLAGVTSDRALIVGSPSWRVLDNLAGGYGSIVFTAAHVAVALLVVVGLYADDRFSLCRAGLLISVVTCNVLAAGFLWSAAEYDNDPIMSIQTAVLLIALSLSSVAGAREPQTNPFSAHASR